MPIPAPEFVVNVEAQRQDIYQNDGVFTRGNIEEIFAGCQQYLDAPNAVMLFHAAVIQGSTNPAAAPRTRRWAATAPAPTTAACGSITSGFAITPAVGNTPGTCPTLKPPSRALPPRPSSRIRRGSRAASNGPGRAARPGD